MFGSSVKRPTSRPAEAGRNHRRAGRPGRMAWLVRRTEWPVAVLSALIAGASALSSRIPTVGHPNRQAVVATLTLAAIGLATAAGVAGAGAGVDSATTRHVAATNRIDPRDRAAAAQRANRSARTATPATPAPTPAKKPAKPPAWVAPMAKFELSSCFGPRWGLMHQGIDFAMPAGTVIRAAGAGTVLTAGWTFAGYGISVVIDHGNGYLTHYAHASKVWVHPGQKVKPGQAIAREGSTGDSTGPHLHFEVHKGVMWHQIDPATFLRARGVTIDC